MYKIKWINRYGNATDCIAEDEKEKEEIVTNLKSRGRKYSVTTLVTIGV